MNPAEGHQQSRELPTADTGPMGTNNTGEKTSLPKHKDEPIPSSVERKMTVMKDKHSLLLLMWFQPQVVKKSAVLLLDNNISTTQMLVSSAGGRHSHTLNQTYNSP